MILNTWSDNFWISFLQEQFQEYVTNEEKPFYCNRCPFVHPGQKPITQNDLYAIEESDAFSNLWSAYGSHGNLLGRNGDNDPDKMRMRIHVFNETSRMIANRYEHDLR